MVMIDGWMTGTIDSGEGDEEDDNLEHTHHITDREEEEENEDQGERFSPIGRKASNDGGKLCVERKVIGLFQVYFEWKAK